MKEIFNVNSSLSLAKKKIKKRTKRFDELIERLIRSLKLKV